MFFVFLKGIPIVVSEYHCLLQIKVLCVCIYIYTHIFPPNLLIATAKAVILVQVFFFNYFFASFPPEKFIWKKKPHNNRWILSNQISYLMSIVASYHGIELFQHLQYLAKLLSNMFRETCPRLAIIVLF